MIDWDIGMNGIVNAGFLAEHQHELDGATRLQVMPAYFYGMLELRAVLVPTLERVSFTRFQVGRSAGSVYVKPSVETNEALSAFSELTSLRYLDLNWCYLVDDTGIDHLVKLQQLENLTLESEITDRGLAELSALSQLQTLDLTCSTNFDGKGFSEWPMTPKLRALVLSQCTNIGDAVVSFVEKAPMLDYLDLGGCAGLTRTGLASVRGGSKLARIVLNGHTLDLATIRALRENNPLAEINCDLEHLDDTERAEAAKLVIAPRRR